MWIGKNYIDGEFCLSDGEKFNKIDPATEQSLGTFFNSTTKDVDKAYDMARLAFKSWRKNKPGPKS